MAYHFSFPQPLGYQCQFIMAKSVSCFGIRRGKRDDMKFCQKTNKKAIFSLHYISTSKYSVSSRKTIGPFNGSVRQSYVDFNALKWQSFRIPAVEVSFEQCPELKIAPDRIGYVITPVLYLMLRFLSLPAGS